MRETALYHRIKPKLDTWGAHSRIENVVESGMPDTHYCFSGQFGWLETKIAHSGKLYFEKFQIPWMRRYVRAHAPRIFVLASLDNVNIMHLYTAVEIIKAPYELDRKWKVIRVEDLAPTLVMTKPYNWDMLRLQLIS